MLKLRLASFLLLCSSTFAQAGDLELICPCEVEAVSDTMVRVNFSIARHFEEDDLAGLYVALRANDTSRQFNGGELLGSTELDMVPTLNSTEQVQIELPWRFSDNANTDLVVAERLSDGGILPYKVRRLKTPIRDAQIRDKEIFTSGISFRSQPSLTLTDSEIRVTVPEMINLGSAYSETLVIRLILRDPTAGTLYRLKEERLTTGFASRETIPAFTLTTPNDLNTYPDTHSDLTLEIISLDDAGDPKFLLLNDTLSTRDDPTTLLANSYQTSAIDFMSDTDGDGISDFNEQLFGIEASEVDHLQKWEIKLTAIGTEEARGEYSDLQSKVEHLINHTNNIFELSGVRAALSLANYVSVGSTLGNPIQGVNDDDPNQLDMLLNFEAPFESAETYHKDRESDVVVAFGRTVANDEACGVATGWGSADANSYPAKTLSSEYKHELFVVGIDCSDFVLAHEFGHVAGLGHSQRQKEMGISTWSRGYGVDDEFVTVMAYASEFQFPPKVELFSSNGLSECGTEQTCGIDRFDRFNGADAVYTLNQTIPHLAALKNGYHPVINLKLGAAISIGLNQPFQDPGATASDIEDGSLDAQISISGEVNSAIAGDYSLTYRVSDSDGNTGEVIRVVTVSADADFDQDGISDSNDPDDDNDGTPDMDDAFPFDASETLDTDGDGVGNNADTDDDGDGVPDSRDIFPLDANESVDTDGDGIGNNADMDDDGDGVPDSEDAFPLDPSKGSNTDTLSDSDGDGYDDAYELNMGSDPNDSQSIPRKGLPGWLLNFLKGHSNG